VDGDDDDDKLRERRLGVDGDEGIRRGLPGRTFVSSEGWGNRLSGIDWSPADLPGVTDLEESREGDAMLASVCGIDRGTMFGCSKSSFVLVPARIL
jgi:hypothetical protein